MAAVLAEPLSDAPRYLCWRCALVDAEPGACLRCQTPKERIDDGHDPILGTLAADRYWVLGQAGAGGHAVVYRARQKLTGRRVALKILRSVAPDEDQARFAREAEAIARLGSPAVVKLYDAGHLEDRRRYLALEWIEGRPLDEHLAEVGPRSGPELQVLLAPVVEALAEIHEAGLVHRDLKARNLMWVATPQPHLRLLDFGLVKPVDPTGPAVTLPDRLYGTPAYMAPEQWSEAYGPINPATDVYAFGVLLYEALTGRWPFAGPGVAELMQAHLHQPPPALPPGPWADLVRRCLEKRPDQRWSNGAALRAAWGELAQVPLALGTLELPASIAGAETVGARPPPLPSMPVPQTARGFPWRRGIGALLASASIALGLWWVHGPQVAAPGSPAAPSTQSPRPAPAPAPLPDAPTRAPLRVTVRVQGPTSIEAFARSLRSKLEPCAPDTGRHRLYLVMAGGGTIDALEVRPNDPAGQVLRRCAEPVLRTATWPTFDGLFATVSWDFDR